MKAFHWESNSASQGSYWLLDVTPFNTKVQVEEVWYIYHTRDTEFSVTNVFWFTFFQACSVETSCYVSHFGQYICGYFLQYMWIILTLMHELGVPI